MRSIALSQDESVKKAVGEIRKLDKGNKVQFIVLYGSLAGDKHGKLSDIDLAIGYGGGKKERFDFRVRTLGKLGDKFDVQIFQDLPVYVREEIVKSGKVLFCKDFDSLFNAYLETLKEYAGFEKYLNLYYSYLEGAEIEGVR